MRSSLAETILPGALAVVGIVVLVLWAGTTASPSLQARALKLRVPQAGRAAASADVAALPLVGKLVRLAGTRADLPGAWPRFRGERFDGICDDGVPLARTWPAKGPEVLWSVELGEGHAGAAVLGGAVYVLDYDRQASADTLRCLSLADGGEIWNYSYPVLVKRNHGMSRTTPAVTEQYVVALGPKCHVSCLDSQTGECLWMLDLVREHGAKVPQWYAGQCPLVDGDRAILAPGGEALLMAVDCRSGEVIWSSPNRRAWKMTHSSIMPMEFAGRRTYVYCGSGGVAGISAEDGSLLWETTDWKISIATCPSPTILPEGKIFLCGGYNAGALMLQIREEGDQLASETLFRLKAPQFGSAHHTPILYGGHLYGVREDDEQLVCLDLEGNQVWSSGSRHKFGLGPYMIGDGMIYVMNDSGRLTLVEATAAGYRQLAQADVLDGHDSWGPMAMAAGRLILRDLTRMICLDVAKQ